MAWLLLRLKTNNGLIIQHYILFYVDFIKRIQERHFRNEAHPVHSNLFLCSSLKLLLAMLARDGKL